MTTTRNVLGAMVLAWVMSASGACGFERTETTQAGSEVIVADFGRHEPGQSIPDGWRVTRGTMSETMSYRVERSKDTICLKCSSRNASVTIGKDIVVDSLTHPTLRWRWRTVRLPDRGREDRAESDDCAIRLQVIFSDDTVLSYDWSTLLPVGSQGINPYWPWTRYVVVESGRAKTGSWVSEERDIRQDYKRLFGCPPPPVKRVDLLCDSDNTASQAEADMDRIAFGQSTVTSRGLSVLDVSPSGLVVRQGDSELQVMEIALSNNLEPATVVLDIDSGDGKTVRLSQRFENVEVGLARREFLLPVLDRPVPVKISLSIPDSKTGVTWAGDDILYPVQRWEVYLAPGSHADYAYGCSTLETLDLNCDVVEKALSSLDADPRMTFNIESAQMVQVYCERHPENIEKVKTYLKQGRLEIGALWSLPLTGYWDGESYVREISLAKDFLKERLDYEPVIAANHDVPGYPRQLGQIMSKSGIDGFVWSRGGGVPSPLYQEVSQDGSRQLSYLVSHPWLYGLAYDLGFTSGVDRIRTKLPRYLALFDAWPIKKILIPVQTDWSYPDPALPRIVEEWNKRYAYPKLILSTPRQYFAQFSADEVTVQNRNYVTEGWAPGAAGLVPVVDRQDSVLCSLLAAEKYAALNSLQNGAIYPRGSIRRAWRDLALTQDHNFGNQHDAISLKERLTLLDAALLSARRVIESSLDGLAAAVRKSRDGTAIVVFNPLFSARSESVAARLPKTECIHSAALTDSAGRSIPFTIRDAEEGLSELEFIAETPSFGYSTYYLCGGSDRPALPKPDVQASGNSIENRYYRVTVDPSSGVLTSIYDKKLRRELLDRQAPCGGNELIVDRSFKYGAMVIDDDDRRAQASGLDMASEQRHPDAHYLFWRQKSAQCATRVEADAVRARITVKGGVLGSTFEQTITLYAGLKGVHIADRVDWQGRNHAKVKVAFPFLMKQPKFTVGEPYGARTVDASPVANVQKWMEISDEAWGVSMATSAGQHGFVGSTVYPVLFWDENSWSDSEGIYWFSPKPWRYECKFTISSHPGNWKAGGAWRLGWEQSLPLEARIAAGGGNMPDKMSFATVEAGNIVGTVFKAAEDGSGVVMRCYDAAGVSSKVGIKLGDALAGKLIGASRARMSEEKLDGIELVRGMAFVPVAAYGIETLRFDAKEPLAVDAMEPGSPAGGFIPYTEEQLAADRFVLANNYIHNGGFEDGSHYIDQAGPYPDNWDGVHGAVHHWGSGAPETAIVDDPSVSRSGRRCVRVALRNACNGSGAQFCQDLSVTPEMRGKVVRFAAYIKTTRPNTTLCLEAFRDGKRLAGDFVRVTPYGRWAYCYVDLVVPPEAESLALGLRVFDNGDGEAYFDDASLRVFRDYHAWEQAVQIGSLPRQPLEVKTD